jgi:D-sedoheptulose 7-phosphate isomerase
MIFSVGGGNEEKKISQVIIKAIEYAKSLSMKVFGIVGRDGGYTAKNSDVCIIIPTVNSEHVTPHTESLQAVIWHLLVSYPSLKSNSFKWESIKVS